jgi:hypothetical protein
MDLLWDFGRGELSRNTDIYAIWKIGSQTNPGSMETHIVQ